MKAERKTINSVVGKTTDGEIYILEDLFEYNKGFKGATGAVLRPVLKEELEEARETQEKQYFYEDAWREAVYAGMTYQSLAEFVDDINDEEYLESRFEPYNLIDFEDILDIIGETGNGNIVMLEVVGLGRVFSRAIEWETIYDQESLNKAMSYEKVNE